MTDATPAVDTPPVEPAAIESPSPSRARAAAQAVSGAMLVAGLWALLQLWGLGATPFHTHGEAREALVVWELTHGGSWVLPRRAGGTGVEVPSKPPLFHWLGAFVARATGRTDEGSIRFPSATLSLAGVLVTYAAGVALWGVPAGTVGALVTLTSFEWQRAATGARVDMTLTFGLLVAFFAYLFFLRSGSRAAWLVPLYFGITLAVLAKGPVGVALPGLLMVTTAVVQRDVRPLGRLWLRYGLAFVVGVAGLWYGLALAEGGLDFFGKQVLNENVFRLFDAGAFEGGHRHGVGYLAGGLAAGFLPWTLFAPLAAMAFWRARRELNATDPRTYLLLWIAAVFGLYAVAVSKRSVYLLALYPALGLWMGWAWVALTRDAGDDDPMRWWRLCMRWVASAGVGVALILLVATALAAGGVPVAVPIARRLSGTAAVHARVVGDMLAQQWRPMIAALAVAAGAFGWCARTWRQRRDAGALAAWIVAYTTLVVTTQHVIMPAVTAGETYRTLMPRIREVVGTAPLSFYRTFQYEPVFYWGGPIGRYDGPLSASAPRYLLMTSDQWQRATAAERETFVRVPLPGIPDDDERLLLARRRDDA